MNLNKYSKQDLLWVIEKLAPDEAVLQGILDELMLRNEEAKQEKIKYYEAVLRRLRNQYEALNKKYEGLQRIEIPMDVLRKSQELQAEIILTETRLNNII